VGIYILCSTNNKLLTLEGKTLQPNYHQGSTLPQCTHALQLDAFSLAG
jgi:hypothetical protein